MAVLAPMPSASDRTATAVKHRRLLEGPKSKPKIVRSGSHKFLRLRRRNPVGSRINVHYPQYLGKVTNPTIDVSFVYAMFFASPSSLWPYHSPHRCQVASSMGLRWRMIGPFPRRAAPSLPLGFQAIPILFYFRLGRRRYLENDQCRAHLVAHLRRSARRLHRCYRGSRLRTPTSSMRVPEKPTSAPICLRAMACINPRTPGKNLAQRRATRFTTRSAVSSFIPPTPDIVYVAALGHAYGPKRGARRLSNH